MSQWESQTRKMNNHYQSVRQNNTTGDEDDEIQQDESAVSVYDETID